MRRDETTPMNERQLNVLRMKWCRGSGFVIGGEILPLQLEALSVQRLAADYLH
jgi:hypothetical protein